MPSLVRISDIGLYLRCPRLVYFDTLGTMPRLSNPANLLLRGLMFAISGKTDLEGQLKADLAKLEQELPLVYEIDPDELRLASNEVAAMIPEIANGLSSDLGLILPSEVEVDLRSDRLGLSGRLDRLVADGHVPSIIRTGKAPEDGVWKRDRLVLAGYALLLREKYGTRIDRGLVEYPRSGLVREVQIHSVDRGRVLRIRDRVQQIKEGQMPDRPEDALCDKCEVKARCETRVSLASKFF